MPHTLEVRYGLTAQELLDAIEKRMRLRVALEGAVAEVHFERKLRVASREGWLGAFTAHDEDGFHDFTVDTLEGKSLRVEVKTIRNGERFQVEVQKTRASKGDPASRYYGRDQFDVLAVCAGRKSGDWTQFYYVLARDLPEHADHPGKLKVMHSLPTPDKPVSTRWMTKFQDVINAF